MIYNTKETRRTPIFFQAKRPLGVAAEEKMSYLQIRSDNILKWEKAPSSILFYTLSIPFIGIYVMHYAPEVIKMWS